MDQNQAVSDYIAALQAREAAQPGPGQNPMGLERMQGVDPRDFPAFAGRPQIDPSMMIRPPPTGDPMAMQPPAMPPMPIVGMDDQAKRQALVRALMQR